MDIGLWFMEDFKASLFHTPKASAVALTLKESDVKIIIRQKFAHVVPYTMSIVQKNLVYILT